MEWSQPQTQGNLVSPRAGHAGVTIDESWYIVGGGDNKSGMWLFYFWNYKEIVSEKYKIKLQGSG